jgi:hypothetical protein
MGHSTSTLSFPLDPMDSSCGRHDSPRPTSFDVESSSHNSPPLSPSLFVPRDSPTLAQGAHAVARKTSFTPAIEIIDLTSDNDEPEPKFKPRTSPSKAQRDDRAPRSESGLKFQRSTLAQEDESKIAPFISINSIFTHTLETSTFPTAGATTIKKDPDTPSSSKNRRSQSKSRSATRDPPITATGHQQAATDSTKLRPFKKEWAERFRRRQREKYRSPTRQTARRPLISVPKRRRAKRPITQAKTSRWKKSKTSVTRIRDVYDDHEDKETLKDAEWPLAETRFLPGLGICVESTMEDVRDFDKKDGEFEKAFADTCDQVLTHRDEVSPQY